ncbi:MAG: hypothetical protein KDE59_00870, partial [Anaerolineales bacterium]|nr:hypothetical protein [Anaerolineales bacterium]
LSRLRNHVSEALLLISRPEVALDSAGVTLDCQAFRAGLQEAQKQLADGSIDLDALSNTLALYRGECAAGFTVLNAPEFESWLLSSREAERQFALRSLFDLTRLAIERQAAEAGLLLARKLVALEPWHEEGQYQLIYLLAVSGQRSAALAQFERCREQLAVELAVEPAEATLALYEQIQNGALQPWTPAGPPPAPAPLLLPPARHNLPAWLTPFIGRETEQTALRQLLAGPERLLTLLGEGGLGKTRLALATAEQMVDSFADGVWFIPLAEQEPAGISQADLLENRVAVAIATAMNLTFAGASPPATQLVHYLQSRELLLVLDNFEPWRLAAGFVRQLLQTAPRLTILVTSREPLQLQAERIFRLEGLPLPTSDSWADGLAAASVQLFAERAQRAASRELLTEATLPIISQLCRLVNGLPLGIELMAHWCRWLPLDLIAADLPTYLLSMDAPLGDLPTRHRSLRAVFDYSWQLLTKEEQLLLVQLTIFRGSFSLASIGPVTGSSPALLFSLLNKSLVQHLAADRYQLHDLLRAFATDKGAEVGQDSQTLAQRHSDYYLGRLRHFAVELNGPQPLTALHEASTDLPNLQQCWQWATT